MKCTLPFTVFAQVSEKNSHSAYSFLANFAHMRKNVFVLGFK